MAEGAAVLFFLEFGEAALLFVHNRSLPSVEARRIGLE
jgi:hypothetical protein